ncbi:hypothetical protein ES703_45100 [subsurface metagenome]
MNATVVKFDALSNADGSATDDYRLVSLKRFSLILLLIGAIEVGGSSIKLSGTGIYHLINRSDIPPMAQLSYLLGESIS